jgi:hypothetical protein
VVDSDDDTPKYACYGRPLNLWMKQKKKCWRKNLGWLARHHPLLKSIPLLLRSTSPCLFRNLWRFLSPRTRSLWEGWTQQVRTFISIFL